MAPFSISVVGYYIEKGFSVIVDLPSQFDAGSMHTFVEKVITADFEPIDNNIEFNLNTVTFIRPSGVAIFSNVIEWLLSKHVTVSYQLPKVFGLTKYCPIKFLDDSLFFERYMNKKLMATSKPRDTTIPLKCVCYSDSFSWLDNHLLVWLSSRLNLSTASIIKYKGLFC